MSQKLPDSAASVGGKPWKYALIPHDMVAENMSLAGLSVAHHVSAYEPGTINTDYLGNGGYRWRAEERAGWAASSSRVRSGMWLKEIRMGASWIARKAPPK